MASCASGSLKGIFEIVCVAGGLSGCEFIAATSATFQTTAITALATSSGDVFLYFQKDGKSNVKVIPWSAEENSKPTALAFSPTTEWLLVACEDGSLCILPIGKHVKDTGDSSNHRFSTNDVVLLQANGSRAKPTAVVWWQTVTGDASVAIIGTELGELCFVELTSGKDVGGTYITVPVKDMYICQDNSLDTVYLLITSSEQHQWRLILEQKSQHYMFPLENISPEWDEDDNLVGALPLVVATPSPRLRLLNLKQLSVEKFQLLKQRISEAKHSSKKKPLTENKGVDTCDIDEEPTENATIITPQSEVGSITTPSTSLATPAPAPTFNVANAGTTSAATDPSPSTSALSEGEPATPISTRPERLSKYTYDVVATPQYTKEKCLLAGHYKPNSCLMVYSTDLENTPLYVYKLPEDTEQVVLHEELIFALRKELPERVSIISTFYSASTKINGEIDNKINPVLQDVFLPEGEEILYIFGCPPSPSVGVPSKGDGSDLDKEEEGSKCNRTLDMDGADSDYDYEVDLQSHTKPNACFIVTKTSLYLCQTRKSVENLFMELALGAGDMEAASKLAVVFSLDSKLFEVAADARLHRRCFASAIALYKQSRCPHVKCSLKFAWAGFVPEFITYMSSLTSGAGTPDMGPEQRRHLTTLAVLAHLHQLSLPAGVRTTLQQQTTLRNLLLLLRNNVYYDEIFTLVVAAATWRWETLQYLASSRGLLLEKLHALLNLQTSPIIASLQSHKEEGSTGAHQLNGFTGPCDPPICREREKGFLHCISDPQLRGVLLVNPLLARSHMAFVLDHLNDFNVAILRRLAALYDPTQPAIKPFLLSAYFHKPAPHHLVHHQNKSNHCYPLLPPASSDPIGLETLTQIFLAVLSKLNQRRGWKYIPDLLTHNSPDPLKKEPFLDSEVVHKSLSCGYGHSVVVIDGVAYSWGLGDYGALGHGPKSSTSSRLLEEIHPVLINEYKDLIVNQSEPELPASKKDECLVQSPDGTEGDCFQPRCIAYLSTMKTYSVSCGKNFALAITNYGVYGWGSSRYGQIGTGGTGRYPRPTLITSLVGMDVIQVACGQFHSLAVTKDGRLFTWGWGVHGQLGHRSVEDCLKPTLVKRLAKKKIVSAAGGYAHSVALTDKGEVYAWGCGTYGQVGTGGISKITSPVEVHLPNPATHLVAGYFHNVVVTSDHKVFVWGSNPACLRVQAQLQRKNRFAQQQQQQQANLENSQESTFASGENNESVCDSTNDKAAIDEGGALHEDATHDTVADEDKVVENESKSSVTEGAENYVHLEESKPCAKAFHGPHLVSANTVPSCDPQELGHLLPKEVEMPHNYGAVKILSAGNQHSLLLTSHGSLYAWGRNMSGQLGTGNRKECLNPIRILDDCTIYDVSSGADFNLALDSHGQIWGWGSNYYSQLGQGSNVSDDKSSGNKVFLLRTSKRVLKVPHSVQSNVEVPRPLAHLPLPNNPSVFGNQYLHSFNKIQVDLNEMGILKGMALADLESPLEDIEEKDMMEDKDDGLYGIRTLHAALSLLHHHYSPKNIAGLLNECEGHQALATLYTLEKQHSKAMHHQLCALLSHSWSLEEGYPETVGEEPPGATEEGLTSESPPVEGKGRSNDAYSSSHVSEAVRILDHFLRLQTEESQSGMRLVLQEGIGLWLSHSLPLPQLEELLLAHLPRTVYPLALLLFGEENTSHNSAGEGKEEHGAEDIAEATARVLSQLSTKFCLNLCSSVISHLQAGECNLEQLDALSQLVRLNPSTEASTKDAGEGTEEKSPYNALVETLAKEAPDAINLSPEEVATLKTLSEDGAEGDKTLDSVPPNGAKHKLGKGTSQDKDCVVFTCGHHFTNKDFKAKVLPQLEKTVTTVPGLLGKTARVLLDQYHSDQPQMACPHCVLAHLTIKLTKHNQPS